MPGPDVAVKARAPFHDGADHHADGGEFVLGLDDRVFGLAVLGDAQLAAMLGESVRQRRGGRDRIPGADRRAAIDRAERGGRIAFDEDAVADLVGFLDADRQRAFQVGFRPVAAEMQRVHVGRDQLVLALVLLADQLLDRGGVHVEQGREHADIDDVLEQLALARIGIFAIADLGQRHADDADVGAEFRRGQGLGRVIEQIAARLDRRHVLVEGLRIHRDHEIDAAARAEMPGFGDAHLVPGRQALDVGGEDIARGDRHAHAQDRAREHFVGAGRARSVHIGEPDHKIIHALDRHPSLALAIVIRYFCMSQAPVGQRSAHSPQCRQTSSSFTITRPVFRLSAT